MSPAANSGRQVLVSYRRSVPALILALLVVSPVGVNGQTTHPEPVGLRPDAPTYAKHGPYWVGTREFVIKDAPGGRERTATLWYPALNPNGAKETNAVSLDDTDFTGKTLTLDGHALVEAPPDPFNGLHPLVVFSHGDPGTRLDSLACLAHLASYGFMVLSLDHGRPKGYRSEDVGSAICWAEGFTSTQGAFTGLIDAKRVAVVGHSVGGFTALQMGGAGASTSSTLDPRVKAIVSMAPTANSGMDFKEAKLPTMLMTGSSDRIVKLVHVEEIYAVIPASDKSLVVFKNRGHAIFFDPSLTTFWPGLNWGPWTSTEHTISSTTSPPRSCSMRSKGTRRLARPCGEMR